MSIISPKTGALININSEEYEELLSDPKYRQTLFNPSIHSVEEGKVEISGTPPFKSSQSRSPPSTKLPPLKNRKTSTSSLNKPELPLSPRYRPSSPSVSLSNIEMPLLPVANLPTPSPNSVPVLNIPIKSSPSLQVSGKMDKKLPISSTSTTTNKKNHLNEILAMPFADIPTLEETLTKTKQPAKRDKLKKMIHENRYLEGRGIKTRGWDARSPTRGKERQQLHDQCGDKCFLLPESKKFPICASPRMGKTRCELDCQGVLSSYIRARQWKYDEVAQKAEKILEKCNKDGLEHFVPKKTLPQLSPSIMVAAKMEKKKVPDCGCGD